MEGCFELVGDELGLRQEVVWLCGKRCLLGTRNLCEAPKRV